MGRCSNISFAAASCNGGERERIHIGAGSFRAKGAYGRAATGKAPQTSRRMANSAAVHKPTQAINTANALPVGCGMHMRRIEVITSA